RLGGSAEEPGRYARLTEPDVRANVPDDPNVSGVTAATIPVPSADTVIADALITKYTVPAVNPPGVVDPAVGKTTTVCPLEYPDPGAVNTLAAVVAENVNGDPPPLGNIPWKFPALEASQNPTNWTVVADGTENDGRVVVSALVPPDAADQVAVWRAYPPPVTSLVPVEL